MTVDQGKLYQIPKQLRWDPFDMDETADWVHGLHLVAGAGDPSMKAGLAIYIFAAGKNMGKEAFYSADGDFLIVGTPTFIPVTDRETENAVTRLPNTACSTSRPNSATILVRANETAMIPRGFRYRVTLPKVPHEDISSSFSRATSNSQNWAPLGPME